MSYDLCDCDENVPITSSDTKKAILDTARDCVAGMLYYDRKDNCGYWPCVGDIDRAVRAGDVTIVEIITAFGEELVNKLT